MPVTPINPALCHTPESIAATEQAIERLQGYVREAVWPKFEPAFRHQYNRVRFDPRSALLLTFGKLALFGYSLFGRNRDNRMPFREFAKELPWAMPRARDEELKDDAIRAAWNVVHYWLAILHDLPRDADGFTQWASADFSQADILRQHPYWPDIQSHNQLQDSPLTAEDMAYIMQEILNKLFASSDIAVVLPDIKIRRQDAGATPSETEK